MSEIIKIKRGLDINLKGSAVKTISKTISTNLYAIKPTDFIGLTPKLCVNTGELVKTGTPVFFDKNHPEIKLVSPVSGKVIDVSRGEKRKILAVIIESDGKNEFVKFNTTNPASLNREKIISTLLESGVWPLIIQRPYNTLADPTVSPKAIFISGFDSAPLAPDLNFIMKDLEKEFKAGTAILKKLTDGAVHLSLEAGTEPCAAFNNNENVVLHYFKGPHPAGNVGIQIHHIDPINKGEIVWVVSPQDVAVIGKLFLEGIYDNSMTIAVTGSEVNEPAYYKVIRGTSVIDLLKNNISANENRIISGDVLSGKQISKDGFLCYYDNQISVIPEGNYYDFLGWALPGFGKFSVSRSFFSWLNPSKKYALDTNLKGGERAFVMTGEYEKVLPMDIYPVQLLKAILAGNIDRMEQLGIYEVVEEDLALCEFVCTSKTEVQSILRNGLDIMKKEME